MTNLENQDEEQVPLTFHGLFLLYCNYDPKEELVLDTSTNRFDRILLSQADFWMQKAEMIGKDLTLTETGLRFLSLKKWRLNFEEFLEYLNGICKAKDLDMNDVKETLFNAGPPTPTETIKIK